MAFQPGVSGNPGGRPKGVRAYLHERYGERGEQLLDELGKYAFGKKKCPPSVRVAALSELLDRGWGKSPQVVAGDPDAPLQHRVVFGGRFKADGSLRSAEP